MLPVSSNYSTIINDPAHYAEVRMIVGELDGTRTSFGMDQILSLTTHSSLYGDYIDIGKCVINEFEAVLTGVSAVQIPKMSRVEVWVRLRVGSIGSNWLPRGVFYTRKPNYDEVSHRLSISGLDLMYRGEALPYPIGSTVSGWNTETTRTVAGRMATFMGIDLEDATQIPEFAFALPPFGYTAREILHDIGTACGGNFTLTYVNSGTQASPQMSPKLRFIPIEHTSTPLQLGRDVQSFSKGDQIPLVSYVCVNYGYDQDGATLSKVAGTEGGTRDVEFTISTITDGDVIQAIATNLYNTLSSGLTYVPWTATGIPFDPCREIGDMATCNGLTAVIGGLDIQFSKALYASIVAPPIPEEEDFPMYSADREIQRNYETEASRIAGAVKFVNLSTPGETEINGSNIKSGTIKLGGDNNGNGQMTIYDENDDLCGSWNNEGIIIYDESDTSTVYSSNNKIRVIRRGDADDTVNALKMGVDTSQSHTNIRRPYIQLVGLVWDNTKQGYKTVKNTIMPNYITIESQKYTSQSDYTNEILDIEPYPVDRSSILTFTKTNNSSTANMTSYTMNQWARVVQLTIHLTNANYASDGAVMWEGDITMSGAVLPMMVDTVTGVGNNGTNHCIAQMYADSANSKWHLVVRAMNGYQANWTANLSFTFLV